MPPEAPAPVAQPTNAAPAAPAQMPRMRVSDMGKPQPVAAPMRAPVLHQGNDRAPFGTEPVMPDSAVPAWARDPNAGAIPGSDPAMDSEEAAFDQPQDMAAAMQQQSEEQGLEPEVDYAAEYQKMQELREKGDIPDEWLDEWFDTVPFDGKPERMTLREMRQYAQMGKDYTFKTQQAAAIKRDAEASQASFARIVQDMDDSRGMIHVARSLGKMGREAQFANDGQLVDPGAGLLGAASLIAVEMAKELEIKRSNPEAYRRLKAEQQQSQVAWQRERENQQLRAEIEQMKQQPAQNMQQLTQDEQVTVRQLQQFMGVNGPVIKRTGLPLYNADGSENGFVRDIFDRNYEAMHGLSGGKMSAEFLTMVARETKRQVDGMIAAAPQANPAPPSSAGMAPRAQIAQPGQQQQRQQPGQQRRRVSEMGKHFTNGYR